MLDLGYHDRSLISPPLIPHNAPIGRKKRLWLPREGNASSNWAVYMETAIKPPYDYRQCKGDFTVGRKLVYCCFQGQKVPCRFCHLKYRRNFFMLKAGCFKHQPQKRKWSKEKLSAWYSLTLFNHVLDLTTMVTFLELSNMNPLALILWGHLKLNEKRKKWI